MTEPFQGRTEHTPMTRIITELTAIAGIPRPNEEGYSKLDKYDAAGFIMIARNLLPEVEAVRKSHTDLLEACRLTLDIIKPERGNDYLVLRTSLEAALAKATS